MSAFYRFQHQGREIIARQGLVAGMSVAVFITMLLMLPTIVPAQEDGGLDSEVRYTAADSIKLDMAEGKVYLYGKARVTYEDIELTSDRIIYDLKKEEVFAFGMPDSANMVLGKPNFKQGSHDVESDSIRYNFRSKQGLIKETRTSELQAYVHARVSKRLANAEIHNKGGMLTTCDRPNPHYHFRVGRMIVIPDDKIVTGPAYMRIGNVPTPLAVPFGLFPNKRGGSMGILIPSYGESQQLGFFLLNGGWYAPLGEYADLQLTGDIYSRGSWATRALTSYRKRYRYNGSLDLSYNTLLNSDPEFPDFSRTRSFFVRWSHLLDPKATLSNRFSASVNVGSSNNFTNNFNSSNTDYLSNTFQSNVAWTHLWPSKPYSLGVNFRHSQNTLTRTFDVTIPSVNFNVSRFFPFAGLGSLVATPKWYDRIGVNYSMNFDNQLSTTEDQLSFANLGNLQSDFRNGIRHTSSISTSLKTRFFTVNPEIRATDRMYFEQLKKTTFTTVDTTFTQTDTIPRFAAPFDMSMGASLTSKMYGMFKFRKGKVRAIRHILTPSVGFSYRPDFGTQVEGPYGTNGSLASYSPFDIGIYGKPPEGRAGLLNFGLQNNLEAKVLDKKATEKEGEEQFKKIKLLDFVGLGASHDLLKDSLNWTPVSLSARTTFLDLINVNFNSSFDPYAVDSLGQRLNISELKENGRLARLTNLNTAIGFELRSRKYGQTPSNTESVVGEADPDKGARINFQLPWRLNVNYSYDLSRSFLLGVDDQIRQSVLANGDVTVFKYWKVGATSGYDLVAEEFTPTSLNLYWDLHCWEFNFNIIPLGLRQSFSFRINVKASVLRDLKYERRQPIKNDGQYLY